MDDTSIKGYVVDAVGDTSWRLVVPAVLRSWPIMAEGRVVALSVKAETEEGVLVREIRATSTEVQIAKVMVAGVVSKLPGILWFYGEGLAPLGFIPDRNASTVGSESAEMLPRKGPARQGVRDTKSRS